MYVNIYAFTHIQTQVTQLLKLTFPFSLRKSLACSSSLRGCHVFLEYKRVGEGVSIASRELASDTSTCSMDKKIGGQKMQIEKETSWGSH